MRIGNTREVLQALLQFEADLGLIEGTCHERELRSTHWCDDEMVVVVGTTHRWRSGRSAAGPCARGRLDRARARLGYAR